MAGIPYEVRLNETYSNTTYYVGNNAGWYSVILSVYNTQKNVLWLPVQENTVKGRLVVR